MPTSKLSTLALMLSITLWGTLLGGITYSSLVNIPTFLSALPDSAVVVNGPYAVREEKFWMFIHPCLILSLVVSLILNWKLKVQRKLIGVSLMLYVPVIVVTALYFVPELQAFANSPKSTVSPAEWLVRAQRWQTLSALRGAVMYMGFMPLLLALTQPLSIAREPESATAS